MSAIDEITAERRRQIEVEGWTPEHDDDHESGEMLRAAGLYYHHAKNVEEYPSLSAYRDAPPPVRWPWAPSWWKPKSPRRDLIRAGALCLAEIDRIKRRWERENPLAHHPRSHRGKLLAAISGPPHIGHVQQKLSLIVEAIERIDALSTAPESRE